MQLYSVFTTLLLASSALSIAVPQDSDGTAIASNEAVVEDGVAPPFDPQEFTADESMVKLDERDLNEEYSEALDERDLDDEYSEALDKRSSGSAIVQCAIKLKGTKYMWNGCKATPPFGPAKGGINCSCLARTCVKKAAKTTIPRTAKLQYSTKAGKCHQLPRKSAKPGDLVFWGCGEKGGIHHVAIFTRPGYVIDSPHTGTVVREEKIWTTGICPKVVRCW